MDIDAETFALIARLLLEDIEEAASHRKGKSHAESPPTDEELSFSVQQKEMENLLLSMQDLRVAEGLNQALTTDQAIINAFTIAERSADDDRRAAIALGSGLPMPARTPYQKRVEDRQFSLNIPDNPVPTPPPTASAPPPFVFMRKGEADNVVSPDPYRAKPHRPFQSRTAKECISCMETFTPAHNLRPACGHDWCSPCLVDLVTACLKDESLYPLRCCGQNFIESEIFASLRDRRLLSQFRLKAREFATPPLQRVYCPAPRCSSFLGPASNVKKSVGCEGCGETVCLACKSLYHGDEDCVEQAALTELKDLAREQGWQTCPGCHAVVELLYGCYHMTCRCRAEFCYVCAVPWKQCQCAQWDEERLLDTARQRVANDMGREAIIQPRLYQEQVREAVNHLRGNHDCQRHLWRYRNGGGRCEECYHNLPQFLLVCRGCGIQACVRCARNRLA
ncbi:RBR-type E3 ubiquitin transferase [Pleurotus pulmonarius]